MRLSEGSPFKTCANPPARNQSINRANLYENEMVYHRHQLDYTHLLIFWELITRTLHLHLHLSIFLN